MPSEVSWLHIDVLPTCDSPTTATYMIPGMGSNRVTVTKFLQLLIILELYLELSYFLRQIFIVGTVTEVIKVPKFLN